MLRKMLRTETKKISLINLTLKERLAHQGTTLLRKIPSYKLMN